MHRTAHSRRTSVKAALLACAALGVGAALPTSAPSATATAKAPFVGRWQQTHECIWLVRALKREHLRRIAPSVVGDYFPDKTPRQLARKHRICRGATPQRHSHFFTRDGGFGSLDQDDQQVDDGTYRIIDARTFRIGNPDVHARFHFEVDNTAEGKVLALKPVITRRMRREALAHPLQFSAAGWATAVSYPRHTWKKVPCGMWC
jgi:hypothetical protein